MKTKTALALSVAGILLTGSAALAVNTQTLNGSHMGTTGNTDQLLLPAASVSSTPAVSIPTESAAPQPTTTASSSPEVRNAPRAPASAKPAPSRQPGDDKGGLRTTPETGGDKGGLRTTPKTGDDKSGHGRDD
jgi:hypothetical protein